MARSDFPATTSEATVERAAVRLEATELVDVARAALDGAGEAAVRRCGREAAAVAALVVAGRRSRAGSIGVESVADRLGLAPARVARAVKLLERDLSPPAPEAEIRSLRRSVVAVHELLAGLENGRVSAPRLPETVLADVDPALATLADRSLEDVDERTLEAHRRRLEEDLAMARLGVRLYALVHGEGSR